MSNSETTERIKQAKAMDEPTEPAPMMAIWEPSLLAADDMFEKVLWVWE